MPAALYRIHTIRALSLGIYAVPTEPMLSILRILNCIALLA